MSYSNDSDDSECEKDEGAEFNNEFSEIPTVRFRPDKNSANFVCGSHQTKCGERLSQRIHKYLSSNDQAIMEDLLE